MLIYGSDRDGDIEPRPCWGCGSDAPPGRAGVTMRLLHFLFGSNLSDTARNKSGCKQRGETHFTSETKLPRGCENDYQQQHRQLNKVEPANAGNNDAIYKWKTKEINKTAQIIKAGAGLHAVMT